MKISLLGTDITVKVADTENIGTYCCYRNIIQVDPDVSDQGEIFTHELVEAINHKLELGMEHFQITAMSTALYSFIRDNPMVIADLAGDMDIEAFGDEEDE